MAPYRVTPAMSCGGTFDHNVLINLDTKTWPGRQVDKAILITKDRRIYQIVKQVPPLVIVNTETLLLNKGIVGRVRGNADLSLSSL